MKNLIYIAFKCLILISLVPTICSGQNIGVNNATPDPSAVLDITSTDKGLLVPRVALTSTAVAAPVATPATGLLIFNTQIAGVAPTNVTPGFYFWDGTSWNRFDTGAAGKDWSTFGNSGTIDGTSFIGTTDNLPLNFRINNQKAGRIDRGMQNVMFGYQAGSNLPNFEVNNVFIGDSAGFGYGTGGVFEFSNTVVGAGAGSLSTGTSSNTHIGADAGKKSISVGNTSVGHSALLETTTGRTNVAVGYRSMLQNSTGFSNTALGAEALRNNNSGNNSVAIGDSALLNNQTTGITAVGSKAGQSNLTGARNTYVGFQSGQLNTVGSGNTAVGNLTLRNATIGQSNVAIGDSAMFSTTTGNGNISIGQGAGFGIISGNSNTFIGQFAGRSVATGSVNTFVGVLSGRSATGSFNSFFGQFSGANVTSGQFNTILGHSTGAGLTTGSRNTIVGQSAGDFIGAGSNNTILGADAEVSSSVTNSTAIGSNAAVQGSNQVVIGSVAGINGAASSVNVGIGTINPTHRFHLVGNFRYEDGNQGSGKVLVGDAAGQVFWANLTAGQANAWGLTGNAGTSANTNFIGTTDNNDVRFRRSNAGSGLIGETNTSFGNQAFQPVIPNNNNTAFGAFAMNQIAGGNNNTAVGFGAMSLGFNGSNNTAVGHGALANIDNGNNTVAIGDSALAFTGASGNTAVGSKAGLSNTTGLRNTFIGFNAGLNNTTAGSNTFIGHIAGRNVTQGTLNVAVGDSALAVGSNGFTSMSVAVGSKAGRFATGAGNVFIGHESGMNVTTAAGNTMVGQRAGSLTVSGFANTYLGNFSGFKAAGDHNTLVGYQAGGDFLGSNNIAIGMNAGQSAFVPTVSLTGNNNIFIGNSSAHPQTFISNSVAIGYLSAVTASNTIVLGAVNGVNTATVTPNVGIGTTAPVRRFHVALNGASGGTPNANAVAFFENNSSSFIHMMTPDATENGLLFGRATSSIGGGIIYNNSVVPDGFQFRTGGNVNRMVIDATGSVGIGITTPSERLEVAGNVLSTNGDFYGASLNGVINMGGGIMNPLINIIADATPAPLNANGDEDLYIADALELGGQGFKPGGGSWAAASDARLKKDVQPFSDGLDKVLAINPVSFKYNNKFKHLDNGKTYIGVIAQEIKEVAPYTVELMPFGQVNQEDENGVESIKKSGEEFYSYDSSSLTYMLINAVKELKTMNDEQNRTIEELRREIGQLKGKNH